MVLMPMICWKTARPIATTRAGLTHEAVSSLRPPSSCSSTSLISRISLSVSSSLRPDLSNTVLADKPARSLWQEEHSNQENQRGYCGQSQHPAPRLSVGQQSIHYEGEEYAEDDVELVQRRDRPSDLGRGYL